MIRNWNIPTDGGNNKALAEDLISDCILDAWDNEIIEERRQTILRNILRTTNKKSFKIHMIGKLIVLNKGSQANPDTKNLRPITAISPIRKIIEKNIVKQL
jgi:hypothetical protein